MTTEQIEQTIADIHDAFREGNLKQAEKLLKAWRKINPNAAEMWHQSALLAVHQQAYPQARDYLQKAITLLPTEPIYFNHLGNVLRTLNEIDAATQAYEQALLLKSDFPEVHNNLGNVFYKKGDLPQAILHYKAALSTHGQYHDAQFNLAYAYMKQEKWAEARTYFDLALASEPNEVQAGKIQFALGQIAQQLQEWEIATTHYQILLNLFPEYLEARRALVTVLLCLGEEKEALKHLNVTLTQDPDNIDDQFNAGAVLLRLNHLDDALYHFREVLRLAPEHLETHVNLGGLALRQGRTEAAIEHYNTVLRLEPGNQVAAFTLTALNQSDTPDKPPVDYIQQLFDCYAQEYDQHLQGQLDYQVPALFKAVLGPLSLQDATCLDLGCGTGLLGDVLKPIAKTLVGVDLSAGMLTKALEKEHYDELLQLDIVDYAQETECRFDCVCAADVLNYLGDLAPLFKAVKHCTLEGGVFLFSVESGGADDVKLQQSGRYLHHEDYLKTLAEQTGWTIIQQKEVILRLQRNQSVPGLLFLLQAGSTME